MTGVQTCALPIFEGTTNIDESMLTGESIPVKKIVGNKVFGATINTKKKY